MKSGNLARTALAGAAAALVCAAATSSAARPHHADNRSSHRHTQRGLASYFSARRDGRTTAGGKTLHASKMVAASKTLPLGSRAKVTNLDTHRSVHVTVVDRGPYAKNRIIDVSPKAAKQLGMTHDGVAPVKVEALNTPPGSR